MIGYGAEDRAELSRHFAFHHKEGGRAFHALHDDNLVDPDLYLVNTDAPEAMSALERLRPAPLRPALLVGMSPTDLPYPFLLAPLDTGTLLKNLEQLVDERAEALSRLDASQVVTVPERRRRVPSEPAEGQYSPLRQRPKEGGVLVVDKEAAFSHTVTRLLGNRRVQVHRANDARTASILCKQLNVSLVFINTATQGLDPYRLCEAIKQESEHPVTVIFLVGRYFSYHSAWAKAAGCEGFVNKPLTEKQVASLLEKFLPRRPLQEE
ncbi:MAG: response regulator [Paucimonas sp.]|nr:response regulator [Paucimonas sp.]